MVWCGMWCGVVDKQFVPQMQICASLSTHYICASPTSCLQMVWSMHARKEKCVVDEDLRQRDQHTFQACSFPSFQQHLHDSQPQDMRLQLGMFLAVFSKGQCGVGMAISACLASLNQRQQHAFHICTGVRCQSCIFLPDYISYGLICMLTGLLPSMCALPHLASVHDVFGCPREVHNPHHDDSSPPH